MAQVLGRVVLERFLSELFLGDVSIFRFFGKIRSETPEITAYGGKGLEERLVKNAWPSAGWTLGALQQTDSRPTNVRDERASRQMLSRGSRTAVLDLVLNLVLSYTGEARQEGSFTSRGLL